MAEAKESTLSYSAASAPVHLYSTAWTTSLLQWALKVFYKSESATYRNSCKDRIQTVSTCDQKLRQHSLLRSTDSSSLHHHPSYTRSLLRHQTCTTWLARLPHCKSSSGKLPLQNCNFALTICAILYGVHLQDSNSNKDKLKDGL